MYPVFNASSFQYHQSVPLDAWVGRIRESNEYGNRCPGSWNIRCPRQRASSLHTETSRWFPTCFKSMSYFPAVAVMVFDLIFFKHMNCESNTSNILFPDLFNARKLEWVLISSMPPCNKASNYDLKRSTKQEDHCTILCCFLITTIFSISIESF